MSILKCSREVDQVINEPQKGDFAELGDIKITVKEYKDSLLSLRFRGENGTIRKHKKVRRAQWEDMVLYLFRLSEDQQ